MVVTPVSCWPMATRITTVVSTRAAQDASFEVTVNAEHFGADAQVDLGAGDAMAAVPVNAAGTQLRATITVASAAPVGPRPVNGPHRRSGGLISDLKDQPISGSARRCFDAQGRCAMMFLCELP